MTSYQLGSPDWLIPTIVITAILLLTTIWNYARHWFGGWAAIALTLKLVAILVLAICLLEPMGRGQRPRPQANVLPVLVDTSTSMSMRADADAVTIADQVEDALDENAEWYQRVQQVFDVRPAQFSDRIDPINPGDKLHFEGTASNLAQSLEAISARFKGRPVAGAVLFTDGNLTDVSSSINWSKLGFPVFPVYTNRETEIPDLRIDKVTVSETDFETAPITIDAEIYQQNLEEQNCVVTLKDSAGEVLETQQIKTTTQPSLPVRFRFRPNQSGVSFYRLECSLQGEEDLLPDGVSTNEVTLANNTSLVAINQRSGPYKVLYLAGRPNWEFKYIRRALDEDAEVRLVGLLRLARKQPKFNFRDSNIGSSANPLFAGLGGEEEEIAEQLDEPVLIPIGVQDATELAEGFPSDAETLFPFSAIIIDDLEADFFTQDQLLLLRQFVSVRGGALLILGGEDSLDKGNFGDSILADLAPIYLPRNTSQNTSSNSENQFIASDSFKMQLTREGMLQPFLRLRSTEEGEMQRVKQAPPLKVLNRTERIKPGAVILATASDASGQQQPALISQSFGRGRTSALMFGDLWRWSLQDGLPGRDSNSTSDASSKATQPSDDPAQVWRQLVRWLVSDVQRRVTISGQPTELASVSRLLVDVKTADFTPTDTANIQISVRTPDGTEIELPAESDPEKPGRFSAEVWARQPGGYIATAKATAEDGSEIGSASYGWTSDPAKDEFKRLGINKNLLQEIASQSGGEVVEFQALNQLANSLSTRPVPVTETWTYPLWHRWWILSLAIACFCGEWGIRRWRGLP